jgi:hypothetical protein
MRTAHDRVEHKPVTIVDEGARLVREDRRGVVRLPRQARLRILHRAMRRVAPRLP